MLYDFNDILIQPAPTTSVRSRSQVTPYYDQDKLPLMTAPMDTVVDGENHHYFSDLGITVVLPRIKNPDDTHISDEHFLSYSLTEFDSIFLNKNFKIPKGKVVYALIDVANGHMSDLLSSCRTAKSKHQNRLKLMVGNVANPDTFYHYCLAGADYVRIGIGNGGGCLTTVQTGVGYPMASLIYECNKIKKRNRHLSTKIVADGGFKTYADIIKALALGADYVMLGSVFNKALESCGETTNKGDEPIDQYSEFAK